MVLIQNTNIIIDDFRFSASNDNPFYRYIYFLTHMHAGKLKIF